MSELTKTIKSTPIETLSEILRDQNVQIAREIVIILQKITSCDDVIIYIVQFTCYELLTDYNTLCGKQIFNSDISSWNVTNVENMFVLAHCKAFK